MVRTCHEWQSPSFTDTYNALRIWKETVNGVEVIKDRTGSNQFNHKEFMWIKLQAQSL